MNRPITGCNLELLKSSLTESLGDEDEQHLAEHLSGCEYCQTKLTEFAAHDETWNRVSDVLKAESQEVTSALGHDHDTGSSSLLGEARNFETSPADFAVHFLEPSNRPDAIGQLGEIVVLEVIGHGGMGIVLKGFQPNLNRPVAVKVLSPHLATSGAARQRFAREAQAIAVISHPNVMPIFTVDDRGKLPYIVMPYVDCESLQQRIDREGALSVVDSLRIGTQVADGLSAAHAQGIIHRDIKPANVLIERAVNRVMLTDFGLARAADDASLTRTGVIAGTPQFMSPEQARGDSIDARSDLFSLGSMLYTMLAGHPPFRAESSYAILRRIIETNPRPLSEVNADVPPWLWQFVQRLMDKEPDQRFATAKEVADLMRSTVAHLQQPHVVKRPPELHQRPRFRQRCERFKKSAQTVLMGLFLITAVFVGARHFWGPPRPDMHVGASSRSSAALSPIPPKTMDWNDGIDNQINDMALELQALEQELHVESDEPWIE